MARQLQEKQRSSESPGPTREQITRRAYEIYLERGRPEGRDIEHWLAAEAELSAGLTETTGGEVRRRRETLNAPQRSARNRG